MLLNRAAVYLTAALFSLLISFWLSSRMSVINPDGVIYLLSAETAPAMHPDYFANWPFYSHLIREAAQWTGLATLSAAHLLNALFTLVTVLVFIALVDFYASSVRVLWIAAFVILLTKEWNSVKSFIVRDHGYWAFYLLSLLFLVHFFQKNRWQYAIGWGVSMLIATLFRIEGALFLLLVPFLALRIKPFLQLNMATLAAVVLWRPDGTRLDEVWYQFVHGKEALIESFREHSKNFAEYVLNDHSALRAPEILFLMILVWYSAAVLLNLTFTGAALYFYGLKKRLLGDRALWGYIILNVLITLPYLFQHMFLTERYLMGLTLVMLLWVPFALDRIKYAYLFFLLLTLSGMGCLLKKGHSKQYILDAGKWLADNAPEGSKIYSNDARVIYYSRHMWLLKPSSLSLYDYAVIHTSKNGSKLKEEPDADPLLIFANECGDQVKIYSFQS